MYIVGQKQQQAGRVPLVMTFFDQSESTILKTIGNCAGLGHRQLSRGNPLSEIKEA